MPDSLKPAQARDRYGWLSEDWDAACLTVVVGREEEATAGCFGIDLADPVPDDSDRWFAQPHARVVSIGDEDDDAAVSVVVEDNGFEGSRAVVLRPASKGGKAASIFWNVNGLVIFSCARRGKLLWSGELGMGVDLDGLPRSLRPFAELAEADDEVDPVAVGAAMVATFTGIEIGPDLTEGANWYALTPQVEQPDPLTAETSGLRWEHPGLVDLLATVAPARRRLLAHALAHAAVRQSTLAEDRVVAQVLDTVDVRTPGVLTAAFDAWDQRQQRESHELWIRQNDAVNNDGVEPLREEELRIYRAGYVVNVLRFACHEDDLSALLGTAEAALHVFEIDGHAPALSAALSAAIRAQSEDSVVLVGLPDPPSQAERDAALEIQRRAREQAERDEELAEEAVFWGGRPPTDRMRPSGRARALSFRNRELLEQLETVDDETLLAIRDWAGRRVLAEAGLLEVEWVATALRAGAGADLSGLFQRLFTDPAVVHTSFDGDTGEQVSWQAMALPAVRAFTLSDPYDAACHALAVVGDGPRELAEAIYTEVRERFGLGSRP